MNLCQDDSSCVLKNNFLFQLDSRNSFVLGRPLKIYGIRIGMEFNEVHGIGFGLYSPLTTISINYLETQDMKVEADFSYASIFYYYAFVNQKHWKIASSAHIGRGKANVKVVDSKYKTLILGSDGTPELNATNQLFMMQELGLEVQYKYHWLGLGAGSGYRSLLVGNDNQRHFFDGAVYSVKMKIFYCEMYKSLNKHYVSRKQMREK